MPLLCALGGGTWRLDSRSLAQETDFTVESSLMMLKYYDITTNDLTLGQFLNAVFNDERWPMPPASSGVILVPAFMAWVFTLRPTRGGAAMETECVCRWGPPQVRSGSVLERKSHVVVSPDGGQRCFAGENGTAVPLLMGRGGGVPPPFVGGG